MFFKEKEVEEREEKIKNIEMMIEKLGLSCVTPTEKMLLQLSKDCVGVIKEFNKVSIIIK